MKLGISDSAWGNVKKVRKTFPHLAVLECSSPNASRSLMLLDGPLRCVGSGHELERFHIFSTSCSEIGYETVVKRLLT